MAAVTRLSLRTATAHRGRYILGTVAVGVASGFMVAGSMLTQALSAQMRLAGADDAGQSAGLFAVLSAFGLVVIVAAGFVITNSFQTMIAARSRELALLRAVGMRGRQAFASVLVEGLLVGIVGALVGVALGSVAAWAVIAVAMPGTPLVAPGANTLALSLGVSLMVTLAAVLAPARRATRIPPMAALCSAETLTADHISKTRIALGTSVLILGLGVAFAPIHGGGAVSVLTFTTGALISFAGMSLLAPIFIPTMARTIAIGMTRRPTGRLAVGNLARGRRRTSNTTMAVVLGVTLFTGVNVVLNSALVAAHAAGHTTDDTGTVFALGIGLTGLTILVGLIGVLNTIVLSVRERTRELSLLRAVGMTIPEVRRTITIEGTLVGLVGVTLGITLGLTGSALLMTRLPDEGLPFAPPWPLIAIVALTSLALVTTATRIVAGRAATTPPALAATA